MTPPTAYPLAWPGGFPRSQRAKSAQFRTSLPAAIKNVQDSLRLFASDSGKPMSDVVISSNVTLGVSAPRDPGVAVYFSWDGLSVCIPVDCYPKLEHNLQAIHHIIEARRTELRHGTLNLVRASLQGFAALPAPGAARGWRVVLGLTQESDPAPSRERIAAAHKALARIRHPDAGGSDEQMAELNAAKDAALKELGQ